MAAHARLQDACGCRCSSFFCSEDLAQLSSIFTHQSRQLKYPRFFPVVVFSSDFTAIDPLLQSQGHREKTCLELTLRRWPSCSRAEKWMCFAGGKRPRRPYIWKSRHRRGSFDKAEKLLNSLESVSNVKEEVYGALDGFVAWEMDFPLISVKKGLTTLEREKNWPRIIQIIKWMLEKGQARTMGTYSLFLKALSEEGRTEEAQELFRKVFHKSLECTPLKLFSDIMNMYERHEMYEDILEVFADMEELNIRLNTKISDIVCRTYEKIGDMDRAYRVKLKYAPAKFRWRMVRGKIMKFRNEDKDVAVQRWTRNEESEEHAELDRSFATASQMKEQNSDEVSVKEELLVHFAINDQVGVVVDGDSSDYESAENEDLEIEEDEDSSAENCIANEVYFRHLEGKKEMYVQMTN